MVVDQYTGQFVIHIELGDAGVGLVQCKTHAKSTLQIGGVADDVVEQQGIEFYQDAFGIRVGGAHHRGAAEQAVREALRQRVRLGRAGSGIERHVLGDQLHLVADLAKLGMVAAVHEAGIQPALAYCIGHTAGEEEWLAQLLRPDLHPDFLILLIQREIPFVLLGVLDDVLEGFGCCGIGRRRSRCCYRRGR